MGPGKPELRAVGGSGHLVDQVVRLREFRKRHPHVTVTSPRQNGTLLWRASWTGEPARPAGKGAAVTVTHYELRLLLDSLETTFGRHDSI